MPLPEFLVLVCKGLSTLQLGSSSDLEKGTADFHIPGDTETRGQHPVEEHELAVLEPPVPSTNLQFQGAGAVGELDASEIYQKSETGRNSASTKNTPSPTYPHSYTSATRNTNQDNDYDLHDYSQRDDHSNDPRTKMVNDKLNPHSYPFYVTTTTTTTSSSSTNINSDSTNSFNFNVAPTSPDPLLLHASWSSQLFSGTGSSFVTSTPATHIRGSTSTSTSNTTRHKPSGSSSSLFSQYSSTSRVGPYDKPDIRKSRSSRSIASRRERERSSSSAQQPQRGARSRPRKPAVPPPTVCPFFSNSVLENAEITRILWRRRLEVARRLAAQRRVASSTSSSSATRNSAEVKNQSQPTAKPELRNKASYLRTMHYIEEVRWEIPSEMEQYLFLLKLQEKERRREERERRSCQWTKGTRQGSSSESSSSGSGSYEEEEGEGSEDSQEEELERERRHAAADPYTRTHTRARARDNGTYRSRASTGTTSSQSSSDDDQRDHEATHTRRDRGSHYHPHRQHDDDSYAYPIVDDRDTQECDDLDYTLFKQLLTVNAAGKGGRRGMFA
ncbi:hypothetical protein CC1G_10035 [Coprinopsis cinerea okayama7|uniref:Uncharacterized protein n=1 Tax=Coprinopsis cinerea (strain Okayama-7 / 130 / ATCC MYA-4618 / FGSC 9003) TaxID=240176 RepID=A8NUV2_COPC7|nr:hypothetical protein CC1G_10035 [Coprinopsis cinerea okayama7\|eukprot:XP_001836541.2 hypothetical protein CC1G_10035 [Coprinopsis cinerea okayama7\